MDKLKVISLRYGSLVDFGATQMTYYAISKKIKMPYSTVRFIC